MGALQTVVRTSGFIPEMRGGSWRALTLKDGPGGCSSGKSGVGGGEVVH